MEPIRSYLTPALEIWKETGRKIKLMVDGDSMAPLIKAGDWIFLQPTRLDNLNLGDVVVFLQNENIVVHRLIKRRKIEGKWWLCQKGDNLLGWAWIPEDTVLGRVESIQGANGVLSMARWPWVWKNPIMAYVVSFWITIVEKAQTLKACVFIKEALPVLCGLNKGIFRLVNRMYYYGGSKS